MHPKYRPDIDGLRAVAVVAVVLFHAGVPGFSGGYVGVDVFFVISGFLITQIIYREIDTTGFSFVRFYERRIRRILPALFALLIFTSLASLALLPYDLKQYGKSLAVVPLFLSNFIFWLAAGGYFGDQSMATPLLHTWSLAIEEQFYILFPITMVVLARFGRRAVVGGILVFAAISLAASILVAIHASDTGFYMPYTRAWELMCGAFPAVEIRPLRSTVISDAVALLGLGMILTAIFSFTPDVHWPGYMAIVPCFGTAFVIYGGANGTVTGKVLGCAPVVFVGMVSYSLYLWHWPLIIFASYYVLDPLSLPWVKIGAAALSFPIAVLSWRYIERPFRTREFLASRKNLFRAAFAASAVFFVAGVAIWATKGIPDRFPARLETLNPERTYTNADCDGYQHCIIGAPGTRPSFAIWGDSHARALNDALDFIAKRRKLSGYVFYNLGCRPFLDSVVDSDCARKNIATAAQLKSLHLKSVIITARWDAESNKTAPQALLSSLSQTVNAAGVNGAKVYILLDIPRPRQSVPETMQKQLILDSTLDVLRTRKSIYENLEKAFTIASGKLAVAGKVSILDPAGVFCPTAFCDVSSSGLPLYNDTEHLNTRGASLLVNRVIAPTPALSLSR